MGLAILGAAGGILWFAMGHKAMARARINHRFKNFVRLLHGRQTGRHGESDPGIILAIETIDRALDVFHTIGGRRKTVENKHGG